VATSAATAELKPADKCAENPSGNTAEKPAFKPAATGGKRVLIEELPDSDDDDGR